MWIWEYGCVAAARKLQTIKKLLFDDSDKFRRKGLGLGGNNRRKGKQLTMEFVKPKQQQEETRVKYSKF